MHYIVDANNLAGKLYILKEKDFDKKLIELIKAYNVKKNKKITLVFDGVDSLGDKYNEGNITIIYTPRDNYYKSADDKIIEIVEKELSSEYPELSSLTVITDDRDLKATMERIVEKTGKKITIQSVSKFVKQLREYYKTKEENNQNKDGLSDDEIKQINEEMLKIWQ